MKKTLFFITSAIIFLSACTKDAIITKDNSPSHSAIGLWIGTYNVLAGGPLKDSLYYSFNLRSDSSLQTQGLGADGNTYYGTGRWSLKGTAFSATIITSNLSQEGAVQKATATYDSTAGALTSGMVTSVGGPFIGSFNLSRIN